MAQTLPRPLRSALVGVVVGIACSACSLSGGASTTPTPLATDTATSVPTPSPTTSYASSTPNWTPWQPSETASVISPVATPTMGMAVPSSTPAGPVIHVDPGGQKALTRADAFSAGSWVQGGYQPVGSAQTIEALAVSVGCNGTSNPLEFRFSQTSGTLVLGVAQAIDSASSTEKLTWTVASDGRLTQAVAMLRRGDRARGEGRRQRVRARF
jgi:hypothetical protein